ncbi:amidase [Halococcus hamelinensis]|uniref:Glutamyl-tRNA amidotransferase subunit A n=1 Tax=Halococcus hamelinensis 100A6 TaxID=1132509 RepID=M0LX64_9EURY|nr:amidase family protein [Halococcus hamelinensis]EMA38172.1 glutamyl-tRNA amidotransferase subunit A [Halococcus hamelinensis 100A6]
MSDIPFATATSLARRVRAGDLSPVDVVEAYLDRTAARNDVTNAYVTLIEDDARERAHEVGAAVERGEDPGPLAGVPVALKDLFGYKAGVPATMGSAAVGEFVPEESAVVTERLEAAGAVVIGTTNAPEFGHKLVTENPLHGRTGTPFDPERVSGGSSGGSAAAVADGLAAFAQGSDMGGSIRVPATFCGVYGIKPSFGRVPTATRPDGFALSTPFTSIGPLARTVEDAALALDVLSGPHPRDPYSLPESTGSYRDALDRDTQDLSVAYSPDLGIFDVAERVADVTDDALSDLAGVVDGVDRTDPPYDGTLSNLRYAFTGISTVVFASMVDGFEAEGLIGDGDRERLSSSVRTMVRIGEDSDAVSYKRADRPRTDFYDAVETIFDEYDLLVTPTTAVPPFEHGQDGPQEIDGRSVANPVVDWCLTWPFNLTGHPVASVPAGFVDGLPVGLQVVGRRHADETVLAASAALERVRPWQDTYPGRSS